MARSSTVFVCSACGHVAAKWHGQCPGCEEWNTLVEERAPAPRAAAGGGGGRALRGGGGPPARPVPLREVAADRTPRLPTGIGELDRVLGGGLVPGSLVLLGGSPGHRQVDADVDGARARSQGAGPQRRSTSPARSRPRRSGCAPSAWSRRGARRARRAGAGRDRPRHRASRRSTPSAPTSASSTPSRRSHATDLTGAAGSVGQVREVATRIMDVAKRNGTAVLLVGHVTKEGALAGPARARAPRRLRAAVRGRARAHLPHAARAEEPLRLHERRRRLRDARRRPRRGAGRERPLRRRGHPRARAASSSRRWRARARCSSRCRRWSRPSELVPPRRVVNGIDRNRLALVLAVLARHARRRHGHRGRVRQRRRRRARRRAGRRPRGRAGGRERRARRRRRRRGRARPASPPSARSG